MVGFNVARYTGGAALFDTERVVQDIKQFANREQRSETYSWTEGDRLASGTDVSWTIRPIT